MKIYTKIRRNKKQTKQIVLIIDDSYRQNEKLWGEKWQQTKGGGG